MKLLHRLSQKYTHILWCILFMVAYISYAYYITHSVLSIAYVQYLSFSMNLVSKGVVSYLLGSFAFFMVCILIEAGITTTLLLLLRNGCCGFVRTESTGTIFSSSPTSAIFC